MHKIILKKIRSLIKNNSKSGFTLVETMVTVLLFTFLFGASFAILISGSDAWEINKAKVELQQELRKTMDWMKQDLRQTGDAGIVNVPDDDIWYDAITFSTAAGVSGGSIVWSADVIRYTLDAGVNQIHRVLGSDDKLIASNITSLQIRRPSSTPNIVEVAIEAQTDTPKGVTISDSADFEVKIRN